MGGLLSVCANGRKLVAKRNNFLRQLETWPARDEASALTASPLKGNSRLLKVRPSAFGLK